MTGKLTMKGVSVRTENAHVCPVERAGGLDNRARRWFQNPERILRPYVKKGMTVLDIGCGPGFFSLPLAGMVGESGRVIAADLQEGMIEKLRAKIEGTEAARRITLHKSEQSRIGVTDPVDFALAFYMVHEVPDRKRLFDEIVSILKKAGCLLIVEPKFLHVSRAQFEDTILDAREEGFEIVDRPKVFASRAVLLQKKGENPSSSK